MKNNNRYYFSLLYPTVCVYKAKEQALESMWLNPYTYREMRDEVYDAYKHIMNKKIAAFIEKFQVHITRDIKRKLGRDVKRIDMFELEYADENQARIGIRRFLSGEIDYNRCKPNGFYFSIIIVLTDGEALKKTYFIDNN